MWFPKNMGSNISGLSSFASLIFWNKNYDEAGLRVFLGALIQGVPATANLHSAFTCAGKAYSMPTRGPINIFSGAGPSKISKPPGNTHSHFRTV